MSVSDEIKYEQILKAASLNAKGEKDPNGIASGVAGAKLDAGKISVTRGCLHYFPLALMAVAELSCIGAKKYSWKGWESVSDGINRYGDAMGRHELRIAGDYTRRDSDTGVLEASAVAWNALARLELILRETENAKQLNASAPIRGVGLVDLSPIKPFFVASGNVDKSGH